MKRAFLYSLLCLQFLSISTVTVHAQETFSVRLNNRSGQSTYVTVYDHTCRMVVYQGRITDQGNGTYGMPDSGRQGGGDDLRPPRPERDLPRPGQGRLDQHSFSMNVSRADRRMPCKFQGSPTAWLGKDRRTAGDMRFEVAVARGATEFLRAWPRWSSKRSLHW